MNIKLHKMARTTPAVRREIRESSEGIKPLARRLNLSVATVRKWRRREDPQDRSHRPNRMQTTLSPAQEAIAVAARTTLRLSLDDMVSLMREFVHPDVSRGSLARCFRRHGVNRLPPLPEEQAEATRQHKQFKAYEPGFLHADIKYLPQMKDEDRRRYVYVAIDRATRWVYLEVLSDKAAATAAGFLKRLIKACPIKIRVLLTDNGKEFTDRFCATGERQPTGGHAFDLVCQAAEIEHRLIPPRRPQTNGMVERFNGRLSDVLSTHRFRSGEELEDAFKRYMDLYNHSLPQKALGHKAPIEAMKEWQASHPDLFNRRVYNHHGLDS